MIINRFYKILLNVKENRCKNDKSHIHNQKLPEIRKTENKN